MNYSIINLKMTLWMITHRLHCLFGIYKHTGKCLSHLEGTNAQTYCRLHIMKIRLNPLLWGVEWNTADDKSGCCCFSEVWFKTSSRKACAGLVQIAEILRKYPTTDISQLDEPEDRSNYIESKKNTGFKK